jgi:hypothetical protein
MRRYLLVLFQCVSFGCVFLRVCDLPWGKYGVDNDDDDGDGGGQW